MYNILRLWRNVSPDSYGPCFLMSEQAVSACRPMKLRSSSYPCPCPLNPGGASKEARSSHGCARLSSRLPQAPELDQCWRGLERFIGTLSRQSSSLGGCLNRTDYPMTMNRPCWRNSRWNWLALTRRHDGTN